MVDALLIINAGSSSIKFSVFNKALEILFHGEAEKIMDAPSLWIRNNRNALLFQQKITGTGHKVCLQAIMQCLENLPERIQIIAAGHRVVHGGTSFTQPTVITSEVLKEIALLNPLAPLHQPHNISGINALFAIYPTLTQVAVFDTTFHLTQQPLAKLFAIPTSLTERGIIRYGFHGISYDYIASVLSDYIGEKSQQRVIVAHLGNGASMCAMMNKKSVATSMGFTALDGLMMGTRCGRIDPGVLLYLIQEKNYSAAQVEKLLYQQSGLLGVSGISADVRELLASEQPTATLAIDLFCYNAALEFGSLMVALNGCDAIIFTAGIGENSAVVRKKICDHLSSFKIKLNAQANSTNATIISNDNSNILIGIIPTNEELMIAKYTIKALI